MIPAHTQAPLQATCTRKIPVKGLALVAAVCCLVALLVGTPDRPIANALGAFLMQARFRAVQRFPSFGLFDDLSNARRFGLGISLNIEATK